MPLSIPKNQIIFNYTSGKEYLVLSTQKEYQGHYYEINNKFFAGKEFNANAPEIIKKSSPKAITNPQQNSNVETYDKISNLKLKSSPEIVSLPTNNLSNLYDKLGSLFTKFFCKKKDITPILIKQINENTYIKLQKDPFYETTFIGEYKGTYQTIEDSEQQLPGIISFTEPIQQPDTILPKTSPTTLPPQKLFSKPTPLTGSITGTPKPQDIIPIGPIILGTNLAAPTFPPALKLTWDNIANVPVADPTNVSQWNTFFLTTPYPTQRFTSVIIENGVVRLYGGTGISIGIQFKYNTHLIGFEDERNCIFQIDGSFIGCTNLKTCIIPELKQLISDSFQNCTSLTSIDFPLANYIFSLDTMFFNCTSLKSVNLPLMDYVGQSMFFNCGSLTFVNMPNAVFLDAFCFQNCTSLTSVYFPFVDFSGNDVFKGCTSLVTADLPLATYLFSGFFQNCTSLTTINLPFLDVGFQGLGGSYGDDNFFSGITGNTINLTVPAAFLTCNGGNPDGDIQYLQTHGNTVNITTT